MSPGSQWEKEFERRLKGLMAFRALFAVFLFGSTIFFARTKDFAPDVHTVGLLYAVSGGVLLLSAIYAAVFAFLRRYKVLFAYFQLVVDTLTVTVIIYITGCFASVFSFLYLIVVICACFLLFRTGGMIIAGLACVQYGLMIDLEYYGILHPLETADIFAVTNYSGFQVLYKMVITILAAFGVAFLTSLLVIQEQTAKRELADMRRHLRRVEKMAAVGEMAAGLAHEIKNPLAAMTGAIQMLNYGNLDRHPDDDRLTRIIQREAKRLNSLVTNFLLFARPHKGNVEKIPLDKIIPETVDLFQQGLPATDRPLALEQEITPDTWIEMDPEYLRQILWNFLNNAADAIREGPAETGQISISVYAGKKGRVCLGIADNGCGMTEEMADLIFDPFFTTKSKGSGLGLSVTHRLIESYDGRIDVDSQAGVGTTFTITLPGASA